MEEESDFDRNRSLQKKSWHCISKVTDHNSWKISYLSLAMGAKTSKEPQRLSCGHFANSEILSEEDKESTKQIELDKTIIKCYITDWIFEKGKIK